MTISAKRDNNRVPALIAVSATDGVSPVEIFADPITHRLYVEGGGTGSAIGDPVGGGNPNNILFIDASGNLAQDPNFLWDSANQIFSILGGGSSTPVSYAQPGVYFGSDPNVKLELVGPVGGYSFIDFSIPNLDYDGRIIMDHSTGAMDIHMGTLDDGSFNIHAGGGISLNGPLTADIDVNNHNILNANVVKRVVSVADATTFTPTGDTADINTQANTQAVGTLTINAPTGTPTDGQELTLIIKSTNVQTLSLNGIFRGSTSLGLPVATTGAGKTDRMKFQYNFADTKWDLVAINFGF